MCLVRMYAAGDYLPMFARVANLQSYLATREVVNRTTPELARVGAMECLATLCLANGSQLGSSIAETVNSAIRLIGRFDHTSFLCILKIGSRPPSGVIA